MMRIIDTFICKIPVVDEIVKVYRGRDNNSKLLYFIEIKGVLEEISEMYFEEIKISIR